MRLPELTRELFDYLIAFRQKVDQGTAPGIDQVRTSLESIFGKMEEETRRNPALIGPFSKVKYALASLTDEVLLSSSWGDARLWETELLEQKYFGTNIAGNKFFELIENVDDFTPEVAEIYYLCLVLGFSGYFLNDENRLAHVKASLLEKMGSSEAEAEDIISPEAYTTSAGGATQLPRLWKWRYTIYIGLAVIIAFFVLERYMLWPAFTSTVSDAATYAESVLEKERISGSDKTKVDGEGAEAEAQEGDENSAAPSDGDSSGTSWKADGAKGADDNDSDAEEKGAEYDNDDDDIGASRSSGPDFPSRDGVVILAGMFLNMDFASRRYDNLHSKGYPAMVIERKRKGQKWHYVLLGIYSTRKEAKADMLRLKKSAGYSVSLRAAKRLAGTCLSGC